MPLRPSSENCLGSKSKRAGDSGANTVRDFSNKICNEEGSGGICEVISFQFQILVEPHDCGILLSRQLTLTARHEIVQLTLSKTLSMNCIV